jgi:GxxExxY protein
VAEIKSAGRIASIHEGQLMTYLRLGGHRIGLPINFNCRMLKDGFVRGII